MIRNILILAKKELHLSFFSPVAYVILFAFSLILGYYFFIFTFDVKDAALILPYLFNVLTVLLLFATPFMTMRLVAEERRTGTMEILSSLPFSGMDIAAGKLLGSFLFYLVLLGIPFLHTILLFVFGRPDPGIVIASWIGVVLNGAAFLSFGLLSSAFSRNQIVSAMVCFLILLFFWMFGWVGQALGGTAGKAVAWLSLTTHFEGFTKGVLDLGDAVYYLGLISLNLVVSAKIIAVRR